MRKMSEVILGELREFVKTKCSASKLAALDIILLKAVAFDEIEKLATERNDDYNGFDIYKPYYSNPDDIEMRINDVPYRGKTLLQVLDQVLMSKRKNDE